MGKLNPLLFTPLILQTLIWPVTRPALNFFLRLNISGLDNLKSLPRGVIFVSNHSSELDAIIVPASLPFLSRYMPIFYISKPRDFYSKSGWRKMFYGGFIFRLWGSHSARSGSHNYAVSIKTHLDILRAGKSLLIFPEGKKTLTGKVMVEESRGGAMYLAEKTGYPIVPILITGHFKMTLADFLLRRRQVNIVFGKGIFARDVLPLFPPSHSGDNPYKAASRHVMSVVSRLTPAGEAKQTLGMPIRFVIPKEKTTK